MLRTVRGVFIWVFLLKVLRFWDQITFWGVDSRFANLLGGSFFYYSDLIQGRSEGKLRKIDLQIKSIIFLGRKKKKIKVNWSGILRESWVNSRRKEVGLELEQSAQGLVFGR